MLFKSQASSWSLSLNRLRIFSLLSLIECLNLSGRKFPDRVTGLERLLRYTYFSGHSKRLQTTRISSYPIFWFPQIIQTIEFYIPIDLPEGPSGSHLYVYLEGYFLSKIFNLVSSLVFKNLNISVEFGRVTFFLNSLAYTFFLLISKIFTAFSFWWLRFGLFGNI